MSVQVRWSGPAGGEAEVTVLDGERITLRSTTPHAPGARPEGSIESGAAVRVKVARCRRDGERFVVEGRLISATRALLAELEGKLRAGDG